MSCSSSALGSIPELASSLVLAGTGQCQAPSCPDPRQGCACSPALGRSCPGAGVGLNAHSVLTAVTASLLFHCPSVSPVVPSAGLVPFWPCRAPCCWDSVCPLFGTWRTCWFAPNSVWVELSNIGEGGKRSNFFVPNLLCASSAPGRGCCDKVWYIFTSAYEKCRIYLSNEFCSAALPAGLFE